jgi:hypothetical protein
MSLLKKILVVVFSVWLGGHAFAQSYRGFREESEGIAKNAWLRLGPFRFYPLLALKNIGYDDNIYFEGPAVADYSGAISPAINVYLPVRGSLILSFMDNPEYLFYWKEKNQRTFTNSYALGMKYLFLHRFVLSAGYRHSEYREPVSSELFRPTTNIIKGYNFGFFYETARKTSIGLAGEVLTFGYQNIAAGPDSLLLSQTLNRQEKRARFEFYYQLYPESFLFTQVGYTEYTFQSIQSTWRNASSYSGSMGVRFPLAGFMRGLLSFGYRRFNPSTEGQKPFSGLFANTGLEMRLGQFSVRLRYARDIFFSYDPASYYYIDHNYGLGASYYLTDFLRLDYNYSQGILDYPQAIRVLTAEGDSGQVYRKDKQLGHSAGLTVRIYRDIGLGLAWNYSKWTSTPLGFNRRRNFIGATLTYQF